MKNGFSDLHFSSLSKALAHQPTFLFFFFSALFALNLKNGKVKLESSMKGVFACMCEKEEKTAKRFFFK